MRDIYVFLSNDTDFTSNGEKSIQLKSCVEHKEKDLWNLDLESPLFHSEWIKHNNILFIPSIYGYQPFRINNPVTGKIIKATANHVGFDLLRYVVDSATPIELNCQDAMQYVLDRMFPSSPFTVYSDITAIKTTSIINLSGYASFQVLADAYNGFLDFDGFQIRITSNQGSDNGVSVQYGVNLQNSVITENWDNVVTKMKPIGNGDITIPEVWLYSEIDYGTAYTKIVTFDTDTVDNLDFLARLYLAKYQYPLINYNVKASIFHDVLLGDTISVTAPIFTLLMQVIHIDYNVIRDELIGVEFGNYRATPKKSFENIASEIEKNTLQKAQLKIDDVNGIIEGIAGSISFIGDDIADLQNNNTELNVKVDGVTITVNQQINNISELQSATDENASAIDANADAIALQKTYYGFGPDGQTIGRDDSPAQIRLEYDAESKPQVVITDGFNETATIKSNSMSINNVNVGESFIAGNHKQQKLTGSEEFTIWLPV